MQQIGARLQTVTYRLYADDQQRAALISENVYQFGARGNVSRKRERGNHAKRAFLDWAVGIHFGFRPRDSAIVSRR